MMDDSALVEEVLGGDGERTPTDLLRRRGLKRGCNELSSDSESASLSDQELLSSQATTPKRTKRVFRHRKIALRSKSKENRATTLDVLSELKKTNATMVILAEKVKKAEKRIRNMDKRSSSNSNGSSSSSPSSCSSLKKNVPPGIRVRYIRIQCV